MPSVITTINSIRKSIKNVYHTILMKYQQVQTNQLNLTYIIRYLKMKSR